MASGTELFQVICDRDMEGVVAKQATARYTPDATTWVKIKNREYYSQDRARGLLRPPEDPKVAVLFDGSRGIPNRIATQYCVALFGVVCEGVDFRD